MRAERCRPILPTALGTVPKRLDWTSSEAFSRRRPPKSISCFLASGDRYWGTAARGDFDDILRPAMKKNYTEKQGQYLAFIYYYGKIHGYPPSEAGMQQYFRVSPPSVHQMIMTLENHGLIERTPGQARSIRLLIPREELPDLL
jgi:hypothetical protein